MGWPPSDLPGLTLRQLVVAMDARMVAQWDMAATVAALVSNVAATVVNCHTGKNKIKPRGVYDFHPYREKPQRGLKITAENIGILKTLFGAIKGRRT